MLALLALGAGAQFLNVTENNATPITGAGHSYLTGPGGTIQPATGALNFQLELPVPPSRGFTLPFSIHYESDLWHLAAGGWIPDGSVQIGFGGPPIAAPLWAGGWYYPVPQASSVEDGVRGPAQPDQCHWYSDYTFLAPDGSRHALPISPSWGQPAQFCASYPSVLTGRSGRWIGTADSQGDGLSVANVDGLKIAFAGDTLNEFPSSITDRNGNQETIQWSGNGVFTYTDSIGRTAVSSSGFGASGNTIALSGLANPYTITWGTATSSYTVGITSLDTSIGCPVPNGTVSGTQSVITAITLPNGQQYTFSYDPAYGTLSRVTLPGGGWVNYTWGLNPQSQYQSFRYWPNGADGGSQQCGYLVDAPAVVARTISFDGSTVEQELDFTYETAWNGNLPGNWVERETDVMVHDHVAGALHEIHYDYAPISVPAPPNEFGPGGQDAVELQVAYVFTPRVKSASDAAVQESWLDPYSLSTQITTLNGSGNTFTDSLQAWCYDANGMVTEHDEYDNGRATAALPACVPSVPTAFSGPEIRRTLTSYASFAEGTGIFDRPATVQIVNPGDGSVAAETDFQYDTEGNPLQITRVNGSAPAVSRYTYDSFGNRLHYTDPGGNLTQYSWQCGSAYPAQTALPGTTTGTTAITHTVQLSYDCASGRLLSRTDVENSATTNFAYNDALGRLTEVDFPDGGKTTYAYTPNTIETKRLFSGSYWTDAIGHLDGFDRVDRQFTFNNDPNNVDTVDTIFDGQGLPYFISYPYSSTGMSSPKSTGNSAATPGDTFLRDELGRLLSVTRSDGSVATGAYNVAYGTNSDTATTTYTDEAGVQSVVARDGLGRIASAYHLVNGSAYDQATYMHDVLGDLTSVAQGGQARSFSFDQLGRLLTANNPETGAISYQYDPNGNVTQKTDANGTVVTSQYDALNRERTRSFQPGAGVAATPSIAFDYDIDPTGALTSDAYGRLTRVTEGGIVDTFSEYDAVGRPLTADIIVDGADDHTRVARDGVGFPTYELLPDSRYLYLNDDYEGRTESIEDGGFGTKYLHYRDYSPESSLYDQRLGDGLDQGWNYDSRNRLTNVHLYVDGDYGDHSTWRMDLSFGYLPNSMVSSITDNLGSAAQSYSFSYDPLNRLSGWTTSAGLSCGFSMDEYGNVAASSASSPCGMPIALNFNAANNRISGDVYSAAGQLLSDTVGSNYVWDAAGRLVGFTAPGEQASYRYDGLGRRIETTVDGLSSIYVYDPLSHRVADESGGGWTDYVVTPEGERLAVIAGSGAAAPVDYLHLGPLGTTRVITDAAGNNALACGQNSSYPDGSLLTYAPYGAALDCTQSLTPFQFTGKPRDTESGLDDFGARFYSSMQGRYLTPDWSDTPEAVPYANLADPQSLNLYAYAGDSPLSFNDPWGHYLQAPGNCGNPCEVKGKPIPVLAQAYVEARQFVLLMLAIDAERVHSDLQHPATHIALPLLLGMLGPEGGAADSALDLALDEAANSGAENPELQQILRELFQPTDTVPGGTAGAVRKELETGSPIKEHFHSTKAQNAINHLNKLLRKGSLSETDARIVMALKRDLSSALQTGKQ